MYFSCICIRRKVHKRKEESRLGLFTSKGQSGFTMRVKVACLIKSGLIYQVCSEDQFPGTSSHLRSSGEDETHSPWGQARPCSVNKFVFQYTIFPTYFYSALKFSLNCNVIVLVCQVCLVCPCQVYQVCQVGFVKAGVAFKVRSDLLVLACLFTFSCGCFVTATSI